MSKKVDWEKIKTEYVTTDISTRDIAKKHKISYNTVMQRSKNDGWVKARKEYRSKVTAKAMQKAVNSRSKDLTKVLECADGLIHEIEKGLLKGTFDVSEDPFGTNRVNQAANALTKLLEVKRVIQGHQTVTEKQRYELEKARLDLEKEKAAKGDMADTSIQLTIADDIKEFTV